MLFRESIVFNNSSWKASAVSAPGLSSAGAEWKSGKRTWKSASA
eukprot:CAMPEP_0179195632 /NCGR_PEP_ID=MMETSP0796-20121207/97250_1 /TAXON_ID=73915 /ORGANISM="Pyrodinium bahamense, Strain pbaha01" /LENGTH=43 /DNA_ID= /DNA_START= /DNA_END= /DNA_ORIENTATION=